MVAGAFFCFSGDFGKVDMKRTGAQAIWQALVDEGVAVVFGYPGGAIMPAYDALPGFPLRHVLVRHEQGAAHMADGYARACGRVGVAIATSGPGATNLVTGIATAMMDSSPMVCITGQVSSAVLGTDAFQETDITGVTLPITKHNYLVTRAEDIYPTLREAFHLARSGRPGPVHVDVTKDAQQATFDLRPGDGPAPRSGRTVPRSPPADLERAAALVDAAERPIVLSGQGIVGSGHRRDERRLRRARHPVPAALRPAVRRARPARSLASHLGARRGGHRRGAAPDVGGAVLQARAAALPDHLRRTGDDGLRPARRDRRALRPARRGDLGRRRRRRLPDDRLRAVHLRAGRNQAERRNHQQRLSRDGAAVAGVLLQPPLRRHPAAQPGLRQARRGARALRP